MGTFHAVGLCSEDVAEDAGTDAEESSGGRGLDGASAEWGLPVTADPQEIAAWLAVPAEGAGLRVVLA